MTTLIYRGVQHGAQAQNLPLPAGALRLMYRGVAHRSRPHAPAPAKRTVQMTYRGVAYGLTSEGRIIAADQTVGAALLTHLFGLPLRLSS